jgi:hypothetical protein
MMGNVGSGRRPCSTSFHSNGTFRPITCCADLQKRQANGVELGRGERVCLGDCITQGDMWTAPASQDRWADF